MGLAFKPDIDDLRESPAVLVADQLKAEGFNTLEVEPNLNSTSERTLVSIQDAINKADIIVYLVGHKGFKKLNVSESKKVLDFVGI